MSEDDQVHQLCVLTPANVDSCFKAANNGDKRAQACMQVFTRSMDMLKTGTAPCMCCDTEFDRTNMPAVFVILLPVLPADDRETDVALATGMCLACARRGKIKERAFEHLQKMLGGDCFSKVVVH